MASRGGKEQIKKKLASAIFCVFIGSKGPARFYHFGPNSHLRRIFLASLALAARPPSYIFFLTTIYFLLPTKEAFSEFDGLCPYVQALASEGVHSECYGLDESELQAHSANFLLEGAQSRKTAGQRAPIRSIPLGFFSPSHNLSYLRIYLKR